jgi:hypothetical protein
MKLPMPKHEKDGKMEKKEQTVKHDGGKENLGRIIERAVVQAKNDLSNVSAGNHIVLVKTKIKKVDRLTVDNVRDTTGRNIEGYEHEITNYFILHTIKNHGDPKREISRGNVPISVTDFEKIPEIIGNPDIVIFGAKRNGVDRIIYTKNDKKGSTFYYESILGKDNKAIRGDTMYKTNKILDIKGVIANVMRNGKTDLSNAKIARSGGGHPTQIPQEWGDRDQIRPSV